MLAADSISPDARFAVSITLFLALLSLGGSILIYVARGATRWARTEEQLKNLMEDVQRLVKDKDTVHKEMLVSMREDRSATDRRLRWLEETVWRPKP